MSNLDDDDRGVSATFAKSEVPHSYSVQSSLWQWYNEHKRSSGLGWTAISKKVCAASDVAWNKSYYVELENWGRGRGKVSGIDTFEMLMKFRDAHESKIRSEVLPIANSEFLAKFVSMHFSNQHLDHKTQRKHRDLEGFWANVKGNININGNFSFRERFHPIRDENDNADHSRSEVVHICNIPETNTHRVTRVIVEDCQIFGIVDSGIIQPNMQRAILWSWDHKDFVCRTSEVDMYTDGFIDIGGRGLYMVGSTTYARCKRQNNSLQGIDKMGGHFHITINELQEIVDGKYWNPIV